MQLPATASFDIETRPTRVIVIASQSTVADHYRYVIKMKSVPSRTVPYNVLDVIAIVTKMTRIRRKCFLSPLVVLTSLRAALQPLHYFVVSFFPLGRGTRSALYQDDLLFRLEQFAGREFAGAVIYTLIQFAHVHIQGVSEVAHSFCESSRRFWAWSGLHRRPHSGIFSYPTLLIRLRDVRMFCFIYLIPCVRFKYSARLLNRPVCALTIGCICHWRIESSVELIDRNI